MTADATSTTTGEVTVERFLDAPRELVWRAWTEPARFAQWFGTPPFSTPESSVFMDVRPGGEWRATQVSAEDGTQLPFAGHYQEVAEPERLMFSFENPENRGDPNVEVVTLTLRERNGGTEMVMRQQGHLPEEQYRLLYEGYSRFFDRLEEYLGRSR